MLLVAGTRLPFLIQCPDDAPSNTVGAVGGWRRLTPFFTAKEREEAGCQHRLFFSQIEFCDNLIFHGRAALDNLGERLLDANRTIGQRKKITVIFGGRRISKHHRASCKPRSTT